MNWIRCTENGSRTPFIVYTLTLVQYVFKGRVDDCPVESRWFVFELQVIPFVEEKGIVPTDVKAQEKVSSVLCTSR